MIKTYGVQHITITVKDLDKSKEFYSKVCGMKIVQEEKEYVGLTDGTFYLWISLPMDYVPEDNKFDRNRIGLDHWAFKAGSLENLKRIEKTLKSMKIEMEDGGITDNDYGSPGIFTKDPDGMKVEFHI